MDQFSKLPEELIIDILSMLEMEDAVQACVLAKTWKNLWTQVYYIEFRRSEKDQDNMDLRKSSEARWIIFVDHTLMQCTENVKAFYLDGLTDPPPVLTDKWIKHVLDKNVELLTLDIYCDVPDYLFQSSSITQLELCRVKVCATPMVNWSSLKSLRFQEVDMDDELIDNILTGCPVLEEIVLSGVFGIFNLNVMSPSVKLLKLKYIESGDDDTNSNLNIKAPWLRELKISGLFSYSQCELMDISSVSKTTLTFCTYIPSTNAALGTDELGEPDYNSWLTEFNSRWIPMVTKLLKALSSVGDLVIGSQPIQVLWLSKLSGTPSPLFMCKHLSIESCLWKFDLPGIACLLENAPHLETLLIKVANWDGFTLPLFQTEKPFQDGDPHLNMRTGKFMHLKNVKIKFLQNSCHDDTGNFYDECFDFELVEFILRSAIVRDKLILCSSRSRSCSDNCSIQYVPRLSSKLCNTLLKENGAAGWDLKKSKYNYEFTFSNDSSLRPISPAPPS